MKKQSIVDVQNKLLEIVEYIDGLCAKYDIQYFIMGGTALGAIRHKGFIPWDDDIDIFMKPRDFERFRYALSRENDERFILQEWKEDSLYLEYAKLRMNNTTFIESWARDRRDMHHGIFVDIMMLHKCKDQIIAKLIMFIASKYVTLIGLSKRNWTPKTLMQRAILWIVRRFPNRVLTRAAYRYIYGFDDASEGYCYCYFITKAKFREGIFPARIFSIPRRIAFDKLMLQGPNDVKKYLSIRYGDYMLLPSEEKRKASIHALIFDTEKDFSEYIEPSLSE